MIWKCILNDLTEPLQLVPQGILVSLVITGGGIWLERLRKPQTIMKKGGRGRKKKASPGRSFFWIGIFCAVLYGYVVSQISFWSREPESRNSMNLILFGTWGASAQSKAYVIENVLMFIPFGILGPGLIDKFRQGGWCVVAGLSCSVIIETAQRFTGRGYFQIDDIVMNSLGTFFGWLCWNAVSRIYHALFLGKRCDSTE